MAPMRSNLAIGLLRKLESQIIQAISFTQPLLMALAVVRCRAGERVWQTSAALLYLMLGIPG